MIEFVQCRRTGRHWTHQDTGKSGRRVKASQSSWRDMLCRKERAYKVRFQVGVLIQGLYRLLRGTMVAGIVLFLWRLRLEHNNEKG